MIKSSGSTLTLTVEYSTTSILFPLSVIALFPLVSSDAVTVTAVPVFVPPVI